jgi:hypothetical protein
MVAGGNMLDDLWFETWRKPSRHIIVDYCSSVVWQDGSSGRLKSPGHNNMLCGGLPTQWMDF